MRRFGYSILFLIIFLFTAAPGGCDDRKYDEKDMGRLATLTRVVMDIVSSEYIGRPIPKKISEEDIKAMVVKNNTDFEELKLLDKYDMMIVSDGKYMGAIVWDPENGRKLIQDLRCTKKIEEPSWRNVSYGNEFSLSWSVCY